MKIDIAPNKIGRINNNRLIKQKGISLIEVLLVIALVGVMATWGAQSWHHYRQREKLADSARQLLAYLTHLQVQVNRNNDTALLWIQKNRLGCLGSGNNPATPCSALAGNVFILPYPDVTIAISLQKDVGFYGVRNTAQAGSILLNSPAGRIRLIISSRGRMRLCSEGQSISGIYVCQE
ncbi:prepilin peptidase-dependent protein [Yersinia mollaretii]|uniref:Prepilin-type N-terminal cleavage/methylation domain protein n=1 Tax=Yersinia mollaretii (strain ATCC 43969 / DSM 18520 / CIP 103324 / CNY 7263 / WAIP 204) TaxID=349967 RepID=A0ABM9YBX7_YERMW|nr:prepilin peptidase-dependent protein [Yersinia mollaretii]EEQ11366.1 Prepilin-type N-terminal cleavage/methylation domain protein [Yersinia mollaretii ATCC 43969]MDN0112349.1 prepilin peptidase-dependent protein [Yersinia mollaretii]QKJ01622.1 prepilin peptidase-dependent protein [Yersinia mollaretii ATCC 43969]